MYEKDFKTLKEATEAQKIVGGKISSFLSTNEKRRNNNSLHTEI